MNAQFRPENHTADLLSSNTAEAVEAACSHIAPAWPLDRQIAVNPWWPMIDRKPEECASMLATRLGATLTMSRPWFLEQWQQGTILEHHLRRAATECGQSPALETLLAHLQKRQHPARISLLSDLADNERDALHQMTWTEEITQQISQFCASFFDQHQAGWACQHPSRSLYRSWLANVSRDRGLAILMGKRGLHRAFQSLPDQPDRLLQEASEALGVPHSEMETYFHALLLSINGWAGWCAYLGWQAGLEGGTDDSLRQLLAIRLAWEWVIHDRLAGPTLRGQWQESIAHWPDLEHHNRQDQTLDWLWQRAAEMAYQDGLIRQLSSSPGASPEMHRPEVQAVFCIDVRSEIIRRALESVSETLHTLGFAGFFGLPVDYTPLGTDSCVPQLPGLLPPTLHATDRVAGDPGQSAQLAGNRRRRLSLKSLWHRFRWAGPSTFTYVESAGLFYGLKLLQEGILGRWQPQADTGLKDTERELTAPDAEALYNESAPLSGEQRVTLAEGVLRGMSLTRGFAPLVLIAGHGSRSANNPMASGLDCGACCGQSGEVNARLLASLLNDSGVRRGLAERGIRIPASTHFLPALHNTTTDEIRLLDTARVPPHQDQRIECLRGWLAEASRRARRERASALDLEELGDRALERAIDQRSRDGSQVRPEWGLAGNASLIVASRARTRALNLSGRGFLHEYRWEEDADFSVLENIMTAPMIVAHWINLQYYASTVDNRHYGSGNKVLHNVVGGTLGVFEGNGGDLRTGLALQSVHNGCRWVHEPLRLSVFIEAPETAITAVIARHETVRQLIDNEWLYLFRIDDERGAIQRLYRGSWLDAA